MTRDGTRAPGGQSGEEEQREQDEDEQSHASVEALLDHRQLRVLPPLLGGQHQAQLALGLFLGIGLGRLAHAVGTRPRF